MEAKRFLPFSELEGLQIDAENRKAPFVQWLMDNSEFPEFVQMPGADKKLVCEAVFAEIFLLDAFVLSLTSQVEVANVMLANTKPEEESFDRRKKRLERLTRELEFVTDIHAKGLRKLEEVEARFGIV